MRIFYCKPYKKVTCETKTASYMRGISFLHNLYDVADFMLVGSSVKAAPYVEHVI